MKAEELRKSILQLAIQGKLVEQNPADEPASVLLERIRAEKQKLNKEGKIKKDKFDSVIFRGDDGSFFERVGKEVRCIDDEIPFEIPDCWEWVRLSNFNDIYTGNSINAVEKERKYSNIDIGYEYIATKDVEFDNSIVYDNGIRIPFGLDNFRVAKAGSTLLCIEGGSAGRKIGVLDRDVCFGNKLCCFTTFISNARFLYYYIQSPSFQKLFKTNQNGIIGGVSVNTIKMLIVALPPLAEQERIVARLAELEPLLADYERLELQESALEATFPEDLKKSILQYAIQGKLVAQDPADEPASVLLERIRAEKEQLINDKKIKRDKTDSHIFRGEDGSFYERIGKETRCINDEIPFEIPTSWEWCRLSNIANTITKGSSPKWQGISYAENGVLFITSENVGIETLILSKKKFVESKFNEIEPRSILEKGDILTNIVGASIGRTCVYDLEECANINQAVCLIRLTLHDLLRYIVKIMNSNYFTALMFDNQVDCARANLSMFNLANFLIPLPPLAEQQRIVAKLQQISTIIK